MFYHDSEVQQTEKWDEIHLKQIQQFKWQNRSRMAKPQLRHLQNQVLIAV